jgi:hypothetical protein
MWVGPGLPPKGPFQRIAQRAIGDRDEIENDNQTNKQINKQSRERWPWQLSSEGLATNQAPVQALNDQIITVKARLLLVLRAALLCVSGRAQTSHPALRSGPCRCCQVYLVRPLAYGTWT